MEVVVVDHAESDAGINDERIRTRFDTFGRRSGGVDYGRCRSSAG
jgi:hypothetical protein